MRQFTLSTENGTLLGFLVLTADSDDEPQSGHAMIQPHEASLPPDAAAPARTLAALAGQLLAWQAQGEGIALYDAAGSPAADIRQQYLRLGGHTLLLTDLEGNL
ncbi:hypothetical protein H9Q10_08770 [Eikenella sp. S3360]|uniref:Uncharacterized protein n=1 Tax=Eikenella glucosivorans TaxID=2766967 RepID=A0ABS0NBS3_9NEIS|nr:hypothetical protein [Eikenella glucosivorans]MBH5329759.1 hypothetical protein [Eikenella glucosivorans]